jgi:hypothetical protein
MSTQRKKYETKLAAYGYENKFSLERDFVPGDRNPGESKWRSIQFPKVAGSTSHLWAARRFAHRVRHCFAAAIVRQRLCPAAASSSSESVVRFPAELRHGVRQHAHQLYDRSHL